LLFRPPALGDWQSVVAQLKKSLIRRTGVLASQIAPLD
jgi:hypothetical protein